VYSLTPTVESFAESVESRLADGDHPGALEIISAEWPRLAGLDGSELRSLITAVPEDLWGHDPWIIAALAASYRSAGSPSRSAALPHFELAEQHARGGTGHAGRLPLILLHHAASLRSLGQLEAAAQKAEHASALLGAEAHGELPALLEGRAEAALQLGLIAIHLGQLGEALRQLRIALGLSEKGLAPAHQLEALGALAFAYYTLGDFEHAERLLARANTLEADLALGGSPFSAPALISRMLIAVDRNAPADAREIEAALASAAHRSDWEPLAFYARSAAAAVGGQLIEALDLQRRCLATARTWQGKPLVRALGEALRAGLHRHLGEPDHAAELAAGIPPGEDHIVCPATIIAGIRLDAGDPAGCLAALEECLGCSEAHSERTMLPVLLLRAAAGYELAETVSSDLAFDQALYFGTITGIRVPFLVIPRITMLRMLNRAADRYQPEAVQRLLDELRVGSASSGELVEPLSERELDVAQHLFEDKTVGQIAAELFISTNTVKTHVRSIYRKLSASNRKEAVRRVHELGLDVKITPF
jgi:DNA-binding CsgD family transcriptional regulator/tetratricopeptide (TPR) repeat protein